MGSQSTRILGDQEQVSLASANDRSAVNLYIDTCSWINLLNEFSARLFIDNLEFWILHKRIKLYTHEVIVKEWHANKAEKKKVFENALEAAYKSANKVLFIEGIELRRRLEPKLDVYDQHVVAVDKLLDNAIKLTTSDQVKIISSTRNVQPRKAPFHNNKGSTKDAFIIFSALEHFSQQGISFVFVSANTNEFKAVGTNETILHPDLFEDYPTAQVKYYLDVRHAIDDFRKHFESLPIQDKPTRFADIVEKPIEVLIDKRQPLLQQLFDYVETMHRDIAYVPPRVLINNYPFRIGNQNSVYYHSFAVETSNKNLIETLKGFSLNNGTIPSDLKERFPDVDNAELKARQILKYLTRDLVFQVSHNRGGKPLALRFVEKNIHCRCPVCEFRRFRFIESFRQLEDDAKDVNDHLTLAYANYITGNYRRSVKVLQAALQFFDERKLGTSAFIAHFDLSKLGTFLNHHYYNNKDVVELGNKLAVIDFEDLLRKYSAGSNTAVLELIANDKFVSQTRDRVLESHYKIVDGYYESVRGTFSSNRFVWELINHLAEIDSFLNANRIMFDQFNEFSVICNRVFDAMFASHSIKPGKGSRLPYFDGWMLQRMMQYGDANSLNKFLYRYKLKELDYSDVSDSDISFPEMLVNFFAGYAGLRSAFVQYCEVDNESFWDHHNKLFSNAITIISIVKFPEQIRMELLGHVVSFLSVEDSINEDCLKHVQYLIARRGKEWDAQELKKLLFIVIGNPKYLRGNCTEELCNILEAKGISVTVSDEEFACIRSNFIHTGLDGAIAKVENGLIPVVRILNSDLKKVALKQTINEYIEKVFDFDFYYRAAIWGIRSYDESDFQMALNAILPSQGRREIKGHIFGQPGDRFNRVSDFINLAFKENLDTTAERFNPIKELSPYYEWLLDMENFDYERFDPYWVTEYKTRFYYRKIGQSSKVREFLELRLKDEIISDLEKQYYSIYIRRPWENP